MEALDFTAWPVGAEYEGTALKACPICGKTCLPSRNRRGPTMIHNAYLVRGALNITAFCTLKSPFPRPGGRRE